MTATPGRNACARDQIANRYLIRMAALAPSMYNTQPWYFTINQGVLELYADTERGLPAEDPAGRELVIGCGAALANLVIAMRHLGFAADVALLPDVSRPDLLARVRWGRHVTATLNDELLFKSIAQRHTRRGPFDGDVPPVIIGELLWAARQERADLRVVYEPARCRSLADMIRAAELAQRSSLRVMTERARWTRFAGDGRRDGITPFPGTSVRFKGPEFLGRDLPTGRDEGTWDLLAPDAPGVPGVLVLLTTADDGKPGWLAAGQALQRLLLHATARGVAVAFHTQPLEIPVVRERIRAEFTGRSHPQALLRLGRGGVIEQTPRRAVSDVLRTGAA